MSNLNTSKSVDYLIVDGNNLAFRSFYGVKYLSNTQELPVNAVYGFFNSLHTIQQMIHYQYLVVCFDCGRSQKRVQLLDTYKANRSETPEAFKIQIPYIKELIPLMGGTCCEKEGIEADDIMGALCRKIQAEQHFAIIVSADKDLMQCVCGAIEQLIPTSQGWIRMNSEDVQQKMGVRPEQMVDFLALIGDTADNYPGISGVGPKIAAKWLAKYDCLAAIFENINTLSPERFRKIIAQSEDLLRKNQQLAALDCAPAYAELFWERIQNAKKDLPVLIKALEDIGLRKLAQKFNTHRCEQTELF